MGKMSFRDRVKQKAKEAEFSGGSDSLKMRDGMSFFKAKKGKNEIIILPFTMTGRNMEEVEQGELWYRMRILKHFKIGAEGKSVICPRTIGKKCPICEHRQELLLQGREKDDDEVKALTTKKRDIYNVIDLADPDSVKIWEISYYNFTEALEKELRDEESPDFIHDFAEIEGGSVLNVRMSEQVMGKNKFLSADKITFTERDEEIDTDLLEQILPLDKAIVILEYEAIKRMFYDIDDGKPDDSDAFDSEDYVDSKRPKRREESGKDRTSNRRHESEESEERRPPRRREREDEVEEEKTAKRRHSYDEDEKLARKSQKLEESDADFDDPKPSKSKKKDDGECPNGGTFGEDCDSEEMYKHCESCDIWSECRDKTDEMQAAKKRKK